MRMYLFLTELGKLQKVLYRTLAWTLLNIGNEYLDGALDSWELSSTCSRSFLSSPHTLHDLHCYVPWPVSPFGF